MFLRKSAIETLLPCPTVPHYRIATALADARLCCFVVAKMQMLLSFCLPRFLAADFLLVARFHFEKNCILPDHGAIQLTPWYHKCDFNLFPVLGNCSASVLPEDLQGRVTLLKIICVNIEHVLHVVMNEKDDQPSTLLYTIKYRLYICIYNSNS